MPFPILVPSVADLWRGREKPLNRGARHRRRSWGELPRRSSPTAPRGFWVGTRFFFVASEEVRRAAFCCTQVARLGRAGYDDMVKTLGVRRPTRRPPHVRKTEYVRETGKAPLAFAAPGHSFVRVAQRVLRSTLSLQGGESSARDVRVGCRG